MKTRITEKDLENPQRFIGEGLGAPEVCILEAKAQKSADRIHQRLSARELWFREIQLLSAS